MLWVALNPDNTRRLTIAFRKGAVTYGTGIVEVSADIIIPACAPGLPFESSIPYTTDGWIGLSAWGKSGLIQTGQLFALWLCLD